MEAAHAAASAGNLYIEGELLPKMVHQRLNAETVVGLSDIAKTSLIYTLCVVSRYTKSPILSGSGRRECWVVQRPKVGCMSVSQRCAVSSVS